MAKKAKSSRYNIRAVEKTIRVLRLLSDGKPRTLTEISQEVEINTSTTFRLVATPIFDHSGEVFSALSESGPRTRLEPLDQQEELIRLTMQTAQEISAKLGYLP